MDDLKLALQAMHFTREVFGFDLDGNLTPDADVAGMGVQGYIDAFVKDMIAVRADIDDLFEEIEEADKAKAPDAWDWALAGFAAVVFALLVTLVVTGVLG